MVTPPPDGSDWSDFFVYKTLLKNLISVRVVDIGLKRDITYSSFKLSALLLFIFEKCDQQKATSATI